MIAVSPLQSGSILKGRYQVIRQIGGGGFGQVFEVNDGGTLKVLKVLDLEHFNNPEIRKKAILLFQREAEFLSRLRHPGIPVVEPQAYFTWPEDSEEPFHCLVMEKIEGSNLQDWLLERGNKPITNEEAIAWLTQLVKILDLLHQKQYFHRDIKLSNIMLRPNSQLVLVDFGAVREVTKTYLQQQKGDRTGTVIISAGYTPPEQAEGRAVPQSDFFALGRSFVYLLTGKSPLNFAKNPETGELIWRNHAAHVSPQLADLIDRMMAPFPGKRPKNSQEILQYLAGDGQKSRLGWQNLDQTLPGISSLVEKRTILSDRVKASSQSRVKLALAGLLFLGGISLWNLSPDIANALNKQGLEHYNNNRLDTAKIYYQFALFLNPKDPRFNYNLGAFYEDKNQFELARNSYQIAAGKGFYKAYNNLARLEILEKRYAAAVPLLEKGLPLAKNTKAKYDMLKNLGWANLELGRYQEAQKNLETAIKISSDRAPAYCLKAQLLERQQNKQVALLDWRNCLKYGNEKNPDEKQWMNLASSVLNAQKKEL